MGVKRNGYSCSNLIELNLSFAQDNPDWGREFGGGEATALPPSLQKPPSGLGLSHLGIPAVLSYKKNRSLQQAAIGWNLTKSSLRVTADQLWTFYQHEPEPKLHFSSLYWGRWLCVFE